MRSKRLCPYLHLEASVRSADYRYSTLNVLFSSSSSLSSRQSVRLRGRLHRQHRRPGGRRALLRCRLYLHHFPAAHVAGGRAPVHPDAEERGGRGPAPQAPAQRQAAAADADGLGAARGPLPQPHHPRAGKAPVYILKK